MSINDTLEGAFREGTEGTALKQVEFLNMTFTIQSARLHTYQSKQTDQEEQDYIASIILDGTSEAQEAWLGGVGVKPQVAKLIADGLLPVRVKMIKVQMGGGQGYKLVAAEGPVVAPLLTPSANSDGTQTPAQRAQQVFKEQLGRKGDDALLEAAQQVGVELAISFSASHDLMLDASKLTTQQAIHFIKAMEDTPEEVPFE